MKKLLVLDFHDIWLRSADILTETRTYLSFELNFACFVIF